MIFLYLGLILFCIGFIGFIFLLNVFITCGDTPVMLCCTLFCVGVVTILCWTIDRDITPTAMDVYQGKTTLEVTYEDGVPVDSIVIFKKGRK